ncbi:motility associated factor glycosyltransferase family protein [Salinispira pacifica]|uniref:6-hydroxymethylpterin diphosphokinase MptE-like domain-containing protein n=1 Tax=Salinispira pacifica TaxID=1307761 RepID=V5WFM6_9SPIO|nr:6-hydroxymethylpterin diphosphokinase MptE-like protein [Salinispira pacifica]AHC14612.1 hypothetical protein L21SP2_1211 [Salinispira pacifica]
MSNHPTPPSPEFPGGKIYRNERGILCAELGTIHLHSRRNPVKEAEKITAKALDGKQPELPGIVVFGLGLGYHIHAIQKLLPNAEVVCFEPHAEWLELIHQGEPDLPECRIICPEPWNEESSGTWEKELSALFHAGYILFSLDAHKRIYRDWYNRIRELSARFSNRDTINRNTLKRFGQRWMENLIQNFFLTDQSGDIASLQGIFSGSPALLLAGGPGIESVAHELKNLAGKMPVCAVDTAYPFCLRHGVNPDFVLAVDPQYWNTKHFERISELSLPGNSIQPILISETSAHPRTFRLLGGTPRFCKSMFPLGEYFEKQYPPRPSLGSGGSVATTAWDFLRFLGCSPIYTAGLDMGFPGHQTHFKGSYIEETLAIRGSRFKPCEQQSFSYLISGNPVERESYEGTPILSDSRMDIFCDWFEYQLRKPDAPETYSLTPFSRRIPGFQYIDPGKIPHSEKRRTDIHERMAPHQDNPRQNIRISDATFILESLTESLNGISMMCEKALDQMREYESGNSNLEQLLQLLDHLDTQLLGDDNRRIAGFLINDVMESLAKLPDAPDIEEALRRSRTLYSRLGSGAQQTMELIRKSKKRVKNFRERTEDDK